MARLSELLLLVSASAFCASATGVSLAASDDLIQASQGRGLKAFYPPNKGSWSSGHKTPIIMVHVNLMKKGEIVAWTPFSKQASSHVYNPVTKKAKQLGGTCGIHMCHNAFCAGQTTGPNDEVFIFGGHAADVQWFRRYNHKTGKLKADKMSSNRWYPGRVTLPDGKILVAGGVKVGGYAGYFADDQQYNNPTYEVYDPASGKFSGDKNDMAQQLKEAFPVGTYPYSVVVPDGGIVCSVGKTLVKYRRSGPWAVAKDFSFADHPHPPRSYPQTAAQTALPIMPPWNKQFFLAAGGSAQDRAKDDTPASAVAHVIDLTGGPGSKWVPSVMPHPRVMGDAVILCDGTVGLFNGGGKGIAGWSKNQMTIKYRDGGAYKCTKKCSKASIFAFEPAIYDPLTNQWSAKGSLAQAMRPRGYHATAILLPTCQVLVSGSDTTNDYTAELFSPPYLSKGPRPAITAVPDVMTPGAVLTVRYTSKDPVDKAILIRAGAVTHSQAFDARALWLRVLSNAGGVVKLETPANRNVIPPGMYMLVLLTNKGVPSNGQILSSY